MGPVTFPAKRSSVALAIATAASLAFGVAFHDRVFPLGVPGELEAPRLGTWDVPVASWMAMLPAAAIGGAMAAFVVWSLGRVERIRRQAFIWSLVCCVVLGGAFQLFLEIAAPYSLQKWAVLHHGFRAAARLAFDDVPSVLENHARVAAELEPNHVSANPAGWIVVYRTLLSLFDAHPRLTKAVRKIEPHEVGWALTQNFATPSADRAAITVVALISRLLAICVGFPIAWLVGQRFGRGAALTACAMASLVPSSILLAPAVDTVYPTFAALIVALSWHASQRRSAWAAATAGGLIGLGMFFSLCFFVVAGLCTLMVAFRAFAGHRPTGASMLAAGSAWIAVVSIVVLVFDHRVWESWSVNLAKNHEFNAHCGCTYGVWVGVNLVELAVAMGIPATVFLLARVASLLRPSEEARGEGGLPYQEGRPSTDVPELREEAGTEVQVDSSRLHPNLLPKGEGAFGCRKGKGALVAAWFSIVALLDVSGTNLGEVSRLWLFLMPLGAALAVEWLDLRSRRGRAIVASLLLLQAFNCTLLGRELVLLWPSAPRQIQEHYLGRPGSKWASYRRLTDEEIDRRRQSDGDK